MSYSVYFLRPIGMEGPIKIGCSWSPERRLATYCTWSPIPLEIAATIPGGEQLEMRFHHRFAASHMHHEWFASTPALTSTIEAISRGEFDAASLPPIGRRLTLTRKRDPQSAITGAYTRKLEKLQRSGFPIPEAVQEASHTYGTYGEEKARRRALVRKFVDDNCGPPACVTKLSTPPHQGKAA